MNVAAADIRVAVVEDENQQRLSVSNLLSASRGFDCVLECSSASEAIRMLPAARPDVVLMDIKLGGQNGIECIRALKPLLPRTQFMVLSNYHEDAQIFEAIQAGATGYVIKKDFGEALLQAIQELHAGGSPMSCQIARRVLAAFRESLTATSPPPDSPLTPTERQVLKCLARGLMYKEIADELHVSVSTIRTHVNHIYEKLHVHNRTDAVRKGLQRGQARVAVC